MLKTKINSRTSTSPRKSYKSSTRISANSTRIRVVLWSQKSSSIFQVSFSTSKPIQISVINLELANNPLVKRVIEVLDKNKDGSISFLEFVQGLNSLSAGSTQEEKLRFAF